MTPKTPEKAPERVTSIVAVVKLQHIISSQVILRGRE